MSERGRMMRIMQGERGPLRVSPMNDTLRVRNINGQRFMANASYTFKSKEFAQRMAEVSRRSGRNVRTIKTANGWLNYVSPEKYNRTTIRWRQFDDPRLGFDTPALVAFLQQQPEYNPNFSWQQNLNMIGGAGSLDTLESILNESRTREQIQSSRQAEAAIAQGFNQFLIDDGFDVSGLEAPMVEDVSDEDDIFTLLGIAQEEEEDNFDDDLFNDLLDGWFAKGVEDVATDSEALARQTETLETLLEDSKEVKKPTLIDRELDALMQDVFNDAIFGDDETITTPDGRVLERPDTSISALGFAQPQNTPDASAGYWSFIPNRMGALSGGQLTDTRSAWLVTDSLGTVMAAYAYTDGVDDAAKRDQYEAVRAAFMFAQEASDMTPYSEAEYQQPDKLSPGVAVIDGYLTINEQGQWLGWDVKHTSDDHRLEEGDFRYFLDGEPLENPPAQYTRNWVLPRWNPSNPSNRGKQDENYRRLESLIGQQGFDDAQNHAKLARAQVGRSQGGTAEEVLDAIQGNRFQIKNERGDPITAYMPDLRSVLRHMNGVTGEGVGSNRLEVYRAPSNEDGATIANRAEMYAELPSVNGKWLIDYVGV